MWIFYRIAYAFCGMCSQRLRNFLLNKLKGLEFDGLLCLILMFDIPVIVFSSLNILQAHSHHWIMKISYYLSWTYIFGLSSLVAFIVQRVNRPISILRSKDYTFSWGILYKFYILDNSSKKFFRAYSLARFILFAINLVFTYYFPVM